MHNLFYSRFTKKIIEKGIMSRKLSYLKIVDNPIIAKESITYFEFLLRYKNNARVIVNMYAGSVKPPKELKINLGSNANKMEPSKA